VSCFGLSSSLLSQTQKPKWDTLLHLYSFYTLLKRLIVIIACLQKRIMDVTMSKMLRLYYAPRKKNFARYVVIVFLTLIQKQVSRIDFRTSDMFPPKKVYARNATMKNWSFERHCTSECNAFCVTMGARTKITYCTSCCTDDMCNTDNSAFAITFSIFCASLSIFI